LKLGKAYQWENCLTTTDAHADAVAGLPVPLPGLHRTAQPVQPTQLQTAQLSPFVRATRINGFLAKSLLTKHLHAWTGRLKTWPNENDGHSWKKL